MAVTKNVRLLPTDFLKGLVAHVCALLWQWDVRAFYFGDNIQLICEYRVALSKKCLYVSFYVIMSNLKDNVAV